MKKIVTAITAVCLIATLATGCKSDSAGYNISDVMTSLETAVMLDSPIDVSVEDFLLETGLTTDDVAEFVGKKTNVNDAAGIIYVMKATKGQAPTIKTKLEEYRDGTAEFLGNYPEFATAQEITKAGRVIIHGDYLALVVGGDKAVAESDGAEKAYEPIDKALDEAFK